MRHDSIDMGKTSLVSARVQNLAAAPASPVEGQIFYDTVAKQLKIYNNSAWVTSSANPPAISGNTTTIQVERATESAIGTTLLAGEFGLASDTKKLYIGDPVTAGTKIKVAVQTDLDDLLTTVNTSMSTMSQTRMQMFAYSLPTVGSTQTSFTNPHSNYDTTLDTAMIFIDGSFVPPYEYTISAATIQFTSDIIPADAEITVVVMKNVPVGTPGTVNGILLAVGSVPADRLQLTSVNLPGNPTTTTQTAGKNNTTIATTAYTDAACLVVSNAKANKAPSAWINATLLGGWTNRTGTARYYKNDLGDVEVQADLTGGTITAGTALFTLPAGYRPIQPVQCSVGSLNGSAGVVGSAYVDSNGNVVIEAGANTVFRLQAKFRSEQ